MRNGLKSLCFILVLFNGCAHSVSLHAQVITTIAGGGSAGLGDGGPATAAKLNSPATIAIDAAGNLYVADLGNNRIRKISTAGVITTVAGGGVGGDGGLAIAALLHQPSGVCTDAAGNLYIAEMASSGGNRIRKVNTSGIISTIAGTGSASFSGDGGPATLATLNKPSGVTVDPSGNVYIADWGNNRIRKVSTAGMITTVAGGGATLGDGGPAIAAILNNPYSLSFDISGNMFISDEDNNRLRKVDLSGIITTVAGTGVAGGTGDGGPATVAEFDQPDGIVADAGSLYIADFSNNRVRAVDLSTGIVTTAAGTGSPGFAGDGFAATAALLNGPAGVVLDVTGNVYIADYANDRIRKININNHIPYFTGGHLQFLGICEDSMSVPLDSLLSIQDTDIGQTETWVLFKPPLHGTATVAYTTTSTGGVLLPSGLSYTPLTGFSGNDTFQVKVDDRISIDTTTIVVTVHPLPAPGPITGPSDVCIGASITLSDDTTGGTWTATNTKASISGGMVTGIHRGTDTIIYTLINPCGIAKVSQTVTIDTFPDAGAITGLSSICIGSFVVLSDTTSGGAWGCANTTAKVFSGIVTGMSVGVDTVTYSLSNTCGTGSAMHTVTMTTSVPHTAPISGPANSVCIDASLTLADTTAGGVWGSTNAHAIVSGGMVTALLGGIDTITYSVTNGCGKAIAQYPLTIIPLPNPGSILGIDRVCPGYTVILADYSADGVWSSGNTSVSVVSAAGIAKGVAPGIAVISYSLTNSCGSSSAFFPLTVLPGSECANLVNTIEDNASLNIYPNPFNGIFTVELPTGNPNAVITITDIYGKTIQTKNCNLQKNIFNLGNISAGTYIIKVHTPDNIYREKIEAW